MLLARQLSAIHSRTLVNTLTRCTFCSTRVNLDPKNRETNDKGNGLVPNVKPTYPAIRKSGYKWGMAVPEGIMKQLRTEYHGLQQKDLGDETKWHPIYRTPYHRLIKGFILVKTCLTSYVVFAATWKVLVYLTYRNPETVKTLLTVAISFIGLRLAAHLSHSTIVQIYVTDNNKYIRIARLTSFGRRLDMVLPVEQIVPLTETNRDWKSAFIKLRTIPPADKDMTEDDDREFYDETFYMNLRWGGVIDRERFQSALGKILSKTLC